MVEKACARCGTPFTCQVQEMQDGSGRRCWCVDIEIPDDVRISLKERYGDCICPDCLAREAWKAVPKT